jgi:hypothetical protein
MLVLVVVWGMGLMAVPGWYVVHSTGLLHDSMKIEIHCGGMPVSRFHLKALCRLHENETGKQVAGCSASAGSRRILQSGHEVCLEAARYRRGSQ